jgi:hypothetical protein
MGSLDVIRSVLGSLPRASEIEASPASVTYRLGSRLQFRMWGLYGPGRDQLPMIVKAEVSEVEHAVTIAMTSNEGRYLVMLPAVPDAYDRQFEQIRERIAAALSA